MGPWWIRLARKVISNDPRDLRTLGRDLAKHVKGRNKFDHSLLSRFASGSPDPRTGREAEPTFDLLEALCAEFTRLPRPLFFARSYEEAVHMQVTMERYDSIVGDNDEVPVLALPTGKSRRRVAAASSAKEHAASAPAVAPGSKRRTAR